MAQSDIIGYENVDLDSTLEIVHFKLPGRRIVLLFDDIDLIRSKVGKENFLEISSKLKQCDSYF